MKKLFYVLSLAVAVMCTACDKTEDPNNPSNTNGPKVEKPTDPTATGSVNGHDFVDLGLPSGTKWATCNVGANSSEEYGNHFAWGEITTKTNYSLDTYKFYLGEKSFSNGGFAYTNNQFSKYCTKAEYGTVDNKTILEVEDDAATANWSDAWCIPTNEQWTELHKKCVWTWTSMNEIKGYRITSKTTGKSIFLPAAGYRYNSSHMTDGCYYWTSSLYESNPSNAWYEVFDSGKEYQYNYYRRYYGLSIRPVLKQ